MFRNGSSRVWIWKERITTLTTISIKWYFRLIMMITIWFLIHYFFTTSCQSEGLLNWKYKKIHINYRLLTSSSFCRYRGSSVFMPSIRSSSAASGSMKRKMKVLKRSLQSDTTTSVPQMTSWGPWGPSVWAEPPGAEVAAAPSALDSLAGSVPMLTWRNKEKGL